jgi:hypothetical protein
MKSSRLKVDIGSLGLAALAISLCGGLAAGCGSGSGGTGQVVKADPVAASNPDAKGKELLDQFAKLAPDERQSWVQQNEFALMVFDKVQDPDVLAKYKQEIAPLKGR